MTRLHRYKLSIITQSFDLWLYSKKITNTHNTDIKNTKKLHFNFFYTKLASI